MPAILMSRKLKNDINQAYPSNNYVYSLKNIKINGTNRGCSGFITNPDNNSVVYITTELTTNYGYMYRYADNTKDFQGYHNRWARTESDLIKSIKELLTTTPTEVGDHRL